VKDHDITLDVREDPCGCIRVYEIFDYDEAVVVASHYERVCLAHDSSIPIGWRKRDRDL
jgi:hypothetical protein